jgi:hypothetical protein
MDLFNASLFVWGIVELFQVSMRGHRNRNNRAKTRQWMICPSSIILVLHGCALYDKWAVKWLTGNLKFNDTIENARIKPDVVARAKGSTGFPILARNINLFERNLLTPSKWKFHMTHRRFPNEIRKGCRTPDVANPSPGQSQSKSPFLLPSVPYPRRTVFPQLSSQPWGISLRNLRSSTTSRQFCCRRPRSLRLLSVTGRL